MSNGKVRVKLYGLALTTRAKIDGCSYVVRVYSGISRCDTQKRPDLEGVLFNEDVSRHTILTDFSGRIVMMGYGEPEFYHGGQGSYQTGNGRHVRIQVVERYHRIDRDAFLDYVQELMQSVTAKPLSAAV